MSAGSASGSSITIVAPVANKLFRRGNNSTISIPVIVSYVGSPSAIEARFNGGSWQSFAATGSPQTINIASCSRGYGSLDVRFSGQPEVAASVSPVAVGKAIACMGQSNISGRGDLQTAPAAGAYLYDGGGVFRALIDPYDGLPYGGTQTYFALDDTAIAAGSYIPHLAQRFVDDGEPVLFIPANKGATYISAWARNVSTATLYGAAKSRIDAAGGADIIIWHQGEWDAEGGTSQSTYDAALRQLVADWQSDFASPLCLIQKLHIEPSYASQYAVIRAAQEAVATTASGAKRGGDLAGITTALHFTTTAELTNCRRTYAASW